MRGRFIRGLAVLAVSSAAALNWGCGRKPQPKAAPDAATLVEVVAARTGSIERKVSLTGSIRAYNEVALASEVGGNVAFVAADEGDKVSAGQVLVRVNQSEALSGVEQARAALQAARARAAEAETGLRLQQTQTATQIEQAEADLRAGRETLQILEKGARPQERLVAENAVRQAQANWKNAQKDMERLESLFEQGAVAERDVDAARTAVEVAAAALDSAKQQLSLVKEGPRQEEIEVARSRVRQAEEALRLAKAGTAQVEMRRAQVRTAGAAVGQAQAGLNYAIEQLRKTSVKSPITGIVYKRNVEPGQAVGQGIPLMMVSDVRRVYFEATVSELEVKGMRAGQQVDMTVDGLPGRTLPGRIEKVVPVASRALRDFTVKIAVENPQSLLRPGMFARGQAVVAKRQGVPLVSNDALIQQGSETAVFVVENGVARRRQIKLGVANADVAEVTSGLRAGDQVVVLGQQNLSEGDKIRVSAK